MPVIIDGTLGVNAAAVTTTNWNPTNLSIPGNSTIGDASSDTLTINATTNIVNNLGIGTSSPGTKLHILSDGPVIRLMTSNNPNYPYLDFAGSGGSVNASLWGVTGSNSLAFGVGANRTEAMRIDVNGNIVINSTTASGLLTINSNINDGVSDFTKGLVFTNNSSGAGPWTHAAIWTYGSTGFNGSLLFGTDGDSSNNRTGVTEQMRIEAGGNVLMKLTSSALYDTNTGSNVAGYWNLQTASTISPTQRAIIGSSGWGGIFGGASLNASSKSVINSYIAFAQSSNTAGSETGYIAFFTKPSTGSASNQEALRITSDANVTITPGLSTAAGAGRFLDISNLENTSTGSFVVQRFITYNNAGSATTSFDIGKNKYGTAFFTNYEPDTTKASINLNIGATNIMTAYERGVCIGLQQTGYNAWQTNERGLEISTTSYKPVIRLHRPGLSEYKVGISTDNKLYIASTWGGGEVGSSGLGITMSRYGVEAIRFNPDQVSSTDANTLDDYEEGTWAPTFTGGVAPTVTYAAQSGTYVKIGRIVHCSIKLQSSSFSGGSGGLRIGGLPFVVDASNGYNAWTGSVGWNSQGSYANGQNMVNIEAAAGNTFCYTHYITSNGATFDIVIGTGTTSTMVVEASISYMTTS